MKTRATIWMMTVVMAGAIAGCVDNDKSLVVTFADPLMDGDDCVAKVQQSSGEVDYLEWGLLDLSHPAFAGYPQYYLFPQVENRLLENANPDTSDLETNDIQLKKASVRYEFLDGRDVLEAPENAVSSVLMLENQVQVDTYISGLVPASSGDTPGTYVVQVRLISPLIGSQLLVLQNLAGVDLDRVVLGVHLRIKGDTLGGRGIESNDFVFPIKFCAGCLGGTNSNCKDDNGDDILDVNGNPVYPGCYPGQDSSTNYTCSDISGSL